MCNEYMLILDIGYNERVYLLSRWHYIDVRLYFSVDQLLRAIVAFITEWNLSSVWPDQYTFHWPSLRACRHVSSSFSHFESHTIYIHEFVAMCLQTSVTLSHRLYISKVYIHFLFWPLFNIYSPVSIVGSFQCRILWALLTTFISQLGALPSSLWKNSSIIKGSPRMWWRYELVTVPSKWWHCTHMLYCHASYGVSFQVMWLLTAYCCFLLWTSSVLSFTVRTTVHLECGSFEQLPRPKVFPSLLLCSMQYFTGTNLISIPANDGTW